jgi:putative transposase
LRVCDNFENPLSPNLTPLYPASMGRGRRIDVGGALYHVTARGNDRKPIVLDDADRIRWLRLRSCCEQSHGWKCHAWCLLSTHFHLLVETSTANLAAGMHWLNHVYAKTFNRRHDREDHVFGRRYASKLITSDEQLVAVVRYIALNPVKAGLAADPAEWPWCNYGELRRVALASTPPPRRYGELVAQGVRLAAGAAADL